MNTMTRMMSRPPNPPDAIVLFELTSSTYDGKRKTVVRGYRPAYKIRPDYITSTHHEFLDRETVSTDEAAHAEVWFLSPEAYPKSLWVGRSLEVVEGSRVIGSAQVLEILNKNLAGSEDYLEGTWEENKRRVELERDA
jgi:hypothetical protein